MNRIPVRLVVLSLVMAFATLGLAWWVVPLVAAVFAFGTSRRGRRAPVLIPAGAVLLGWGGLLVAAAVRGGADRVSTVLGGVLGLPPWGLYLATPAYGALLAAGAALVASALGARETPGSRAA